MHVKPRNSLVRRQTLYSVLGMPPSSSSDELRSRYLELAQKYHPDRGGDANKFKQLTASYRTLRDPVMRSQYDKMLAMMGNQCTVCAGGGRRQVTRGFTRATFVLCASCEGTGQQLVSKDTMKRSERIDGGIEL